MWPRGLGFGCWRPLAIWQPHVALLPVTLPRAGRGPACQSPCRNRGEAVRRERSESHALSLPSPGRATQLFAVTDLCAGPAPSVSEAGFPPAPHPGGLALQGQGRLLLEALGDRQVRLRLSFSGSKHASSGIHALGSDPPFICSPLNKSGDHGGTRGSARLGYQPKLTQRAGGELGCGPRSVRFPAHTLDCCVATSHCSQHQAAPRGDASHGLLSLAHVKPRSKAQRTESSVCSAPARFQDAPASQ